MRSTSFTTAARAAIVVALLAVAACSGISRPFGKGEQALVTLPGERPPPVALVALDGAPPAESQRLAAHIAREATLRGYQARAGAPAPDAVRLAGHVKAASQGAATTVAYVFDIEDPKSGARKRITGVEAGPAAVATTPWTGVDDAMLQRIAADAASGVSAFLGERGYNVRSVGLPPPSDLAGPPPAPAPAAAPQLAATADPVTTGSVGGASRIEAVVAGPITGARGAGNRDLAEALQSALRRAGFAAEARPGAHRVRGEVTHRRTSDGRERVTVRWTVIDGTGSVVGSFTDDLTAPPGTLHGRWGDSAAKLADAAAEGVFNLLRNGG